MSQFSRTDAIEMLTQHQLSLLSASEKLSHLLDWWTIDEADPYYNHLPPSLKLELSQTDGPNNPEDGIYIPLLSIGIKNSYYGVSNEFLAMELNKFLNLENVEIMGSPEQLLKCPCCEYFTMKHSAEYEVCQLCNWEDDGRRELDHYSSVNHCTLSEARSKFNSNHPPGRIIKYQKETTKEAGGDE